MRSPSGKKEISTFPVGSGTGGKWEQMRGWQRREGDEEELDREMCSLTEMGKGTFSFSFY